MHESRVLALELQVAKLEQSREDLMGRLAERFSEFDGDVKAFAPLVQDVYELKHDVKHLTTLIKEVRSAGSDHYSKLEQSVKELETKTEASVLAIAHRLDEEAQARATALRDARRDRWMRIATLGALIGTFISSTAAVLALVL